MNCFFSLYKLVYLKPRRFIRTLLSRGTFNVLLNQLYDPNQSDGLKAFSAAFGVFMGIVPIWGFQTLAAIFLAIVFKLNKALVFIFVHISFAPFLPIILFLSYRAGELWVKNGVHDINLHQLISLQNLKDNLEQYLYGSLTLAVLAALATGTLMLVFLRLLKIIKQYRVTVMLNKA